MGAEITQGQLRHGLSALQFARIEDPFVCPDELLCGSDHWPLDQSSGQIEQPKQVDPALPSGVLPHGLECPLELLPRS